MNAPRGHIPCTIFTKFAVFRPFQAASSRDVLEFESKFKCCQNLTFLADLKSDGFTESFELDSDLPFTTTTTATILWLSGFCSGLPG